MINRENYTDVKLYVAYRKEVRQDSPPTLRRRRSKTRHLLEWADETPFPRTCDIRPTFPVYLTTARNDGRREPLAPRTIERTCGAARDFFRFMMTEHPRRYRSISPRWIDSLTFKVPGGFEEPRAYTIDQVRAIISLPAETETLTEQRAKASVAFLFLSGARVGAFVTLPINAINLQQLLVEQLPSLGVKTKNLKSATTFLLNIPDLLRVVIEWDELLRTQLSPDALWYASLSCDGTRFTGSTTAGRDRRSAVAKYLKKLCERAGIPYLPPHSMRHGHAVFALDRAITIGAAKAVSQNLMHDSLTTTEKIYGRLTRDYIRREITTLTHHEQPASEQPASDAVLAAITQGMQGLLENPDILVNLVNPFADAVIKRVLETPNWYINAAAGQLEVKQTEGAP